MGLDIGFHLYEKEAYDKEKKLVEVKDDNWEERWMCGRCDVTNAWGDSFQFYHALTITPVFQKELDGHEEKLEEFVEEYKLVSFNEFKHNILLAVEDTYRDNQQAKLDILRDIDRMKEKVKDLRELQKTCTADEEFAFDKWGKEIEDKEESIAEQTDYYNHYDEEDYDYSHAKRMEELLDTLEEYLKEDKYYIIPYFSF